MPVSDYTPTATQLGRFMRARTKTRYGVEVGTFDATTTPSDTEVAELIQQAVDEISLSIGPELPDYILPSKPDADVDFLRKGARAVVLLLSAMNVEASYAPEQTTDERSYYTVMERRYNRLLPLLVEAVGEANGNIGSGDGGGGSVASPSGGGGLGNFPLETDMVDIGDGWEDRF